MTPTPLPCRLHRFPGEAAFPYFAQNKPRGRAFGRGMSHLSKHENRIPPTLGRMFITAPIGFVEPP